MKTPAKAPPTPSTPPSTDSANGISKKKKKAKVPARDLIFWTMQFPEKNPLQKQNGFSQRIRFEVVKRPGEADPPGTSSEVMRRVVSFDNPDKCNVGLRDIVKLKAGGAGFDRDYFLNKGGVYNRKFWDVNLGKIDGINDSEQEQSKMSERTAKVFDTLKSIMA